MSAVKRTSPVHAGSCRTNDAISTDASETEPVVGTGGMRPTTTRTDKKVP